MGGGRVQRRSSWHFKQEMQATECKEDKPCLYTDCSLQGNWGKNITGCRDGEHWSMSLWDHPCSCRFITFSSFSSPRNIEKEEKEVLRHHFKFIIWWKYFFINFNDYFQQVLNLTIQNKYKYKRTLWGFSLVQGGSVTECSQYPINYIFRVLENTSCLLFPAHILTPSNFPGISWCSKSLKRRQMFRIWDQAWHIR